MSSPCTFGVGSSFSACVGSCTLQAGTHHPHMLVSSVVLEMTPTCMPLTSCEKKEAATVNSTLNRTSVVPVLGLVQLMISWSCS